MLTDNFVILNSQAKEYLQIEKFKDKQNIKDFIKLISEPLLADAEATLEEDEFDARPFIRTFEYVQQKLSAIRQTTLEKVEELETEVSKLEVKHATRMKILAETFKEAHENFGLLESRISDVGHTAVKIGEQLETIDEQKQKAEQVKDIIQYFLDLNEEKFTSRLDILFNSNELEDQKKAGHILRRLSSVAKEMQYSETLTAKRNIEKYCEQFENNILRYFDVAYKDKDIPLMSIFAKILVDFNGGASCIQTFINQHEFFINSMNLIDSLESSTTAEEEESFHDPVLQRLSEEIIHTCKEESQLILKVFPNASEVIEVFIQRIFAQSIQSYLERLLKEAEGTSILHYLRTLSRSHLLISELVSQLSEVEVNIEDLGKLKLSDKVVGFSSILNRCKEDLFVQYIEGGRYLEKEVECLKHSCETSLSPFAKFLQKRNQSKLKAILSKQATQTESNSGNKTLSESFAAVNALFTGKNFDEEIQSLLSHTIPMQIFQAHAEATGRCFALSDENDRAKNIRQLFTIIMDAIGYKYIHVALDWSAEEMIQAEKSNTEPDSRFFSICRQCDSVMHLLQCQYQYQVEPLIRYLPRTHRELVNDKSIIFSLSESKLNLLIQKLLDAIVNWVKSGILSKQKRNDYKPKEDEAIPENCETAVCKQITELLTKLHIACRESLCGKNYLHTMTELGIAFYEMLMEHFTKYPVSLAGAIILNKDIKEYQKAIHYLEIAHLNDLFLRLHEVGKLFMTKPEYLKEVIDEGFSFRIDLASYLQMRTDFKSSKIERVLESHRGKEK